MSNIEKITIIKDIEEQLLLAKARLGELDLIADELMRFSKKVTENDLERILDEARQLNRYLRGE